MSEYLDFFDDDSDDGYYYEEGENEEISAELENEYLVKTDTGSSKSAHKPQQVDISGLIKKDKKKQQKKKSRKKQNNKKNVNGKKQQKKKKKDIRFITKPSERERGEEKTKGIFIPDEINLKNPVRQCEKMEAQTFAPDPDYEDEKDVILERQNVACKVSGGRVVIHGGESSNKKLFSDFVLFDSKTEEFKILDNVNMKLNKDHHIFSMHGQNMLFVGNSSYVWILFNSEKYLKTGNQEEVDLKCFNVENFSSSDGSIRKVFEKSVNFNRDTLIFFGGYEKQKRNPTNQLVLIKSYTSQSERKITWSFNCCATSSRWNVVHDHSFDNISKLRDIHGFVRHRILGRSPSARYGHSSVLYGDFLYVYGGNNGRDNLNDLWKLRLSNYKWQKVNIKSGIKPPKLINSALFYSNNTIFLHGGKLSIKDDEPQQFFYSFKLKEKEWIPIQLTSVGENINLSEHKVIQESILNAFIIGGTKKYLATKKELNGNIYKISGLNDIEKEIALFKHLLNMRKKGEDGYCDGKIHVINENKETSVIDIHMCIIYARSSELFKLKEEKENLIKVFNYDFEVVKAYVEYLYSGNLFLKGKKKIEQLIKMSEQFGHSDHIKEVFDPYNYSLRTYHLITERIKTDFEKLLNSEEQTDLTIHCSRDGTVFTCHKLFVTRSTFAEKCLNSGMIEEIESKLIFENLSARGLKEVLRFLYTDEIKKIDFSIAVECCIFGILFKLVKITNFCRKLILRLISIENVAQICELFDMYQDTTIVDFCIRRMGSFFEEISKQEQYERLNEVIKTRVLVFHGNIKMKEEKRKKKEMQRFLNKFRKSVGGFNSQARKFGSRLYVV